MASESRILRSPYLQWLLVQLFPRLREWPVREWPMILAKVGKSEFDQFERIGIMAALLVSAWLLRPASPVEHPLIFVFLSQFLLSLPLLLALGGPFFLRRIRRSLEMEAQALRDGVANATREGN